MTKLMCTTQSYTITVFKRECINIVASSTVCIVGSYVISRLQYNDNHNSSGLEHSILSWNITNPENAWSSILYALPNTEPYVKMSLMTLSISSFCLWSNRSDFINFIDVTSIFWVIICVTIYCIPPAYHKRSAIIIINTATVGYITVATYTNYFVVILKYYEQHLVILTGAIATSCAVILSTFHCHHKDFTIGFVCVTVGFLCKLLTIYNDLYWGTCAFHVLTALGIFILLKSVDIQSAQKTICYSNDNIRTEEFDLDELQETEESEELILDEMEELDRV